MGKITDEKKLNKEQQEAVKYGSGPLLIIAGAGTGKTTVITERIKYLISRNLARPAEILALTFTDKAAREMEERIDIALPYGYTQMWISTFHAFGDRILRQEAFQIGLDPGYKLMTEAESIIFFRKNIFKFDLEYFRPLGNPNKFISAMLIHFSRLKDEDVSPVDYLNWAKENSLQSIEPSNNEERKIEHKKYLELAHAYNRYEELKAKEGKMDFADLIANTLKLFRTRKNILKEYQNQFKFILIDEFQDTNFAQNELAVLLAGDAKNINVVGDDDQAIYRFRGAAVSNIIQFRQRFPETKLIVLTKNYRSTKEILNKSYNLIQNNNPDRLEAKEHLNKKLTSERNLVGDEIKLIYESRVENEAESVAKKIKELAEKEDITDRKYSWKDFAILVRANNQSDPFARTLQRHGIPYQFLGPGMLFRQSEVKDLISYIKVLFNFEDSIALFRVLSMDLFNLNPRDISAILNFSKKIGRSLFESLEIITSYHGGEENIWQDKNFGQYLPDLNIKTIETIVKFVTMFKRHLALIKKETAGQILFYFLEDTGLLKNLTEYKTAKEEKIALNISKFFDKLKSYESNHEDASVSAVIDFIDMSMELGESPLAADMDWVENDAVNILTFHSAKGLEFPVVFLVNLVNQRFPTVERREKLPLPPQLIKEILPEGDFHLEEERRLFYVGMTRARDFLFFTAANYYGEAKRERKISPFIIDTLGEEIVKSAQLRNEISTKTKQLTLLEWQKKEEPELKPVKHFLNYLSYSQIESFMTCPLQYKYKYILKIPMPPTAAGSFGTSVHKALQAFYEKVKTGEKPDKKDLLLFLEKFWLPVGYETPEYQEKMKKRGLDMLGKFFDKYCDSQIIPHSLEQIFKFKISPALSIGGKIDRIDLGKDGHMEIIDYKTGRKPASKEIEDSLQMTVYALAAADPGIYNKNPEEVTLTFYFLSDMEKVSSHRTNIQLNEAKNKLLEHAQKIAESEFKPRVGIWCDFCDFKLICEAWQ